MRTHAAFCALGLKNPAITMLAGSSHLLFLCFVVCVLQMNLHRGNRPSHSMRNDAP